MNQPIPYDTVMWILTDVILAAIIISLTLRLLRLIKRREVNKASEEVVRWTAAFDQLLKENDDSTAVKETFKILLSDLERLAKLKLSKNLTSMEVVDKLCAKFPDRISERLIELYEIYEPIRFGGRSPSREDIWRFRSKLDELEKICGEIVGEPR